MKIAVIAASQVPSSTANSIQVMKVCHSLAQTRAEVRLWLPRDQSKKKLADASPLTGLLDFYGIDGPQLPFEITWLPTARRWKRYDLAWKGMQAARGWGADVVYTWMPQAALLSLWNRLPTIYEIHMLPSGLLGPWLLRLILKNKHKKRLLLITAALRRILEERMGMHFPDADIQISPMGSEPERYANLPGAQQARHLLNLQDGFTAGYTGHFYPGRGMDLLFALARSLPQVNFLWIGGRPQDVAFWKQQLEQSHTPNVTLTGFIENKKLPLYQAAAEVLLMPYSLEVGVSSGGDTANVCSPMKLFDYLAAGRAIISSDLPVFHEILNTSNSIFCPPDDLGAWQQALINLQSDPAHCQQLAAQGQKDAVQYTWISRTRHALEGML